jgi:membrane-bound ClpP family serine protease
MTILGIILLILAGIVLFLLEFLVVPGVTIAGIGGLLLLAASVYLSFVFFDTTTGLIVLVGVVVVLILTLILALRAKTWRKVSLNTDIDSNVGDMKNSGVSPGAMGVTLTRLAPIGTILIGDQRYEGHSEGPYIDQNTPVEVTRVSNTYVVVKPKKA